MPAYAAPLRDMRFVMQELLDCGQLAALPGYTAATADVVDAVLEEGARLAAEVLAPLNRTGDEEGCRFENGVVRTPGGFREAYETFAAGGWTGLAADPAHGGQGLPLALHAAFQEMACAANLAFSIYPVLSAGAYNAIALHGSEGQKRLYLPRLADGSWSGTMCLTEPQAGTDLGLVRTRAEPRGDGSFAISGGKIFISAGEHDLTENIVHLVLARLPDAPRGTRGISLFVVPKFLPAPNGGLGARNAVRCSRIEAKMGLHGAATCALDFDDATGWLVGEAHRGMPAMFTMMNAARLAVGIQGLGVAEAALQGAETYARERLQGRAPGGAAAPEKAADPILAHPDVRRMLLAMRAGIEGGRALAYWVALHADLAAKHPDPARRQEAEDLVALMTPVVKAHLTDLGFEAANLGVQIWGGHGYIRDNGMEQYVRDARIAQIYEGTNGVQALDLVGRKLGVGTGRLLRRFFHPCSDFITAAQHDAAMAEFAGPLARAFARLQQATTWVAQQGLRDPEEAAAAASDYLKLFALVAVGWMWARIAQVALAKLDGAGAVADDAAFYRAKLATARFYMARVLPEANTRFAVLMAGKASVVAEELAALQAAD